MFYLRLQSQPRTVIDRPRTKKGRPVERPKSREETPEEGMCRTAEGSAAPHQATTLGLDPQAYLGSIAAHFRRAVATNRPGDH